MNLEDVRAFETLLSTRQKVVIVPHKNPDGDAIGSSLGLCHYLNDAGHDATVISPNDYPMFLKWMPGQDHILNFEKENPAAIELIKNATLFFTLDFNQLNRSGQIQACLEETAAPIIMIDHHQAPADYAAICYSDVRMSSTSEMVYTLIKSLGDLDKISGDIANCLYAGILTDTGSFKYSTTSSQTHLVAADLIARGANNTKVHHNIYDTNSPERLKLLGCSLRNMVILPGFNTAYTTLSQEELDKHNFKKGDTEGFVNYGLNLVGIRLAAFFIENKEEGIIKISFRSEGDFSVNDFARAHFEGGGHINAAGGKSDLSMDETAAKFESLLPEYKTLLTQ
jgi:phosphoesterase RecJ-like protein